MGSLVEEVQRILGNTSIITTEERRAFGTRRGVPDAVVWLSPNHPAFPDRILPVLIELESTFGAAADDFKKFAHRYSDNTYQYHIQWPAAAENLDPFCRTSEYDIAGIPARRLGKGSAVKEREMYSIIVDWFDQYSPTFEHTVYQRQYDDTTVLNWELSFRMFGHRFQSIVPFFIDIGHDLEMVIEQYIPPPVVPSVVIINDEYGYRDTTTSYHDTMIEFPPIRSIRFNN
ncbi:hypothetical protein [Halalkalirubrum salinum]|uniref:hypothetical protein n=1 Tax=Halalkalirubrum salinum TaxID=2563889 RepID=UPI0010FACF2F|nr:hypothetical protein [Halalkalirubrum salinum]